MELKPKLNRLAFLNGEAKTCLKCDSMKVTVGKDKTVVAFYQGEHEMGCYEAPALEYGETLTLLGIETLIDVRMSS